MFRDKFIGHMESEAYAVRWVHPWNPCELRFLLD